MALYSINDLERLSGIKAHTIRIWEKRYNILLPQRKSTNIRQYNDDELKRLMNIAVLNQHGVKISKLSLKSNEQLQEMVTAFMLTKQDNEFAINQLVASMIDLDELKFIQLLNDYTLSHGFENTVVNLIYPFFDKVGVLWQTGHIIPAHEHFISNLIRQKLIVAIDSIKQNPSETKSTALLFLPEGEYHEFGLLFNYYLLKKRNYKVFYMGQSVPYEDILQVAETIRPSLIMTAYISSFVQNDFIAYTRKLSESFPQQQILISGKLASEILSETPPNISVLKVIHDLDRYLN